jgi:hypothetical protein
MDRSEIREDAARALAEARGGELTKLVWEAVERHIDGTSVDGIAANGVYNQHVYDQQRAYINGLRAGRLAAMNAIIAATQPAVHSPSAADEG